MCLISFGQEIMQGMRDGVQSAGLALFMQFESDSGNGRVWEVLETCSSLVRMFGMCLQYLLKAPNAEREVVLCYDTFLHP